MAAAVVVAVGVVGVAVWVAAVVAVVEGEAMVVTSTLGRVGGDDDFFLPDSVDADSVGTTVAKLGVLPSTYLCACVRCSLWLKSNLYSILQ